MRALRTLIGLLATGSVLATSVSASPSIVHFRTFARTGLRLTDIVWTGAQFLYVNNTTNHVWASGPTGAPLTRFAAMPRQVEETRCSVSPGTHGFTPGDLYCHSPDNKIYRISANGKRVTVFAVLPHTARSDGAISFDTAGSFGYALIVATGRSGVSTPAGGTVFAIGPAGKVRRIGSYDSPGGADEVAIAPASFGSAARQVLLTIDAGHTGSLVAMNAHGQARTLLKLPDGLNPIAVLAPGQTPPAGTAQPGLYVTDTLSHNVFFAPNAELAPYAGEVVIGSELGGFFWMVRPLGHGFAAIALTTSLNGTKYNLEAAIYVAR